MPRPDFPSAFSAPAGAHLPVELLRRYVAGQLPPAEEHAVEAHTLDCTRCADILAGLELQPAATHEASLIALRQRLHGRVAELSAETATEPTVVPMWAWRPLAAAAVLLLSLSVVGWLAVSQRKSSPDMAARPATETTTRKQAAPTTVRPAGPAVAATARPEVAAVVPVSPTLLLRRPVLAARFRRPAPAIAQAGRKEPADVAALDAAGNGFASGSTVADTAPVAEPAAVAMSAAVPEASGQGVTTRSEPVAAKAKVARVAGVPVAVAPAISEATRTIQGRVTDAVGVPLPGATVLVPGTQNAASTDANGNFRLSVPTTTPQLAVSSIGYTTQTRSLRPTDSTLALALALAPSSQQLSEVVVVRREAPPMLPSIAATPAGGYPALRKYLADSLDYPEKALEDKREGTVRVQFMVGTDGKLSDLQVVKSVSPECDEEALRLLKEGPNWFPAVHNNRRVARKVVVNVPFKIER